MAVIQGIWSELLKFSVRQRQPAQAVVCFQYSDQLRGESMTYANAIEPPIAGRPKSLGFIRNDLSGIHAPRHAAEVWRHALGLGHHYVYTVRPPVDVDSPIEYVLGLAAGLGVDVIVVFELGHVDDRPALICDRGFDLETVSPQGTWTRSSRLVSGEGA
ncbi:hypothetical protein AB0L97_22475 [Nocardia sp. NPDC051911]|uniref:hypothetical protein n=1 Tax=Nocardia sp. NPDC051911 TaxID=3154648 RepID=UPI00342D460C